MEENTPSRYDLFLEHQKQDWENIQSSSDEYDKSVLTLSSGGLALSLAFLKDIVPLKDASGLSLLYCSWGAFTIAIFLTVLSFRLSILAHEEHLEHLRKYYLEDKRDHYNKPSRLTSALGILSWIAGASFVLAVTATIIFACINIQAVRMGLR